MKLVSGMQGTRNQEIVGGDKKKRTNKKQWKEEPGDRKDSENHTRRKKTRGKVEWLKAPTVQSLLQQNRGAGGYISLKKGRIPRNLSSFKYN